MHPAPTTPRDTGNDALTNALNVSFRLLRLVMIVVLLVFLFSGVFVVGQHEQAMVLVFGRIAGLGADRLLGPGIHWTLPRPLAEIVRVPTERVQTITSQTFWYRETSPPGTPAPPPPAGPSLRPGTDGYTLTGDANLIHSTWALRFTIENPEAYAFRFRNPAEVLERELDHAVIKTSASFPIDQALRTDIEAFRAAVDREVRQRVAQLGLGIKVERVDVLAVAPPRQVAAAFSAVIEAEQDRSRNISAARADAARLSNQAQGDAARLRAEGETYKREVVSRVSANADYFAKVYEQYTKNPDIIGRTLLQDTLRRTLSAVDEKFILQSSDAGKQELRLLLSPEPQPLGPKK